MRNEERRGEQSYDQYSRGHYPRGGYRDGGDGRLPPERGYSDGSPYGHGEYIRSSHSRDEFPDRDARQSPYGRGYNGRSQENLHPVYDQHHQRPSENERRGDGYAGYGQHARRSRGDEGRECKDGREVSPGRQYSNGSQPDQGEGRREGSQNGRQSPPGAEVARADEPVGDDSPEEEVTQQGEVERAPSNCSSALDDNILEFTPQKETDESDRLRKMRERKFKQMEERRKKMLEARSVQTRPEQSPASVASSSRRKSAPESGRPPRPPINRPPPLTHVGEPCTANTRNTPASAKSDKPTSKLTRPASNRSTRMSPLSSCKSWLEKPKGNRDKANRKVIKNAIMSLFQGEASRQIRETLLASLEGEALRHDDRLLVLFRGAHSGRHDFRALYSLREDKWTRIVHLLPSPQFIDNDMCFKFFRFDCAQREFKELESVKGISGVVDAVFLKPQFLKAKVVTEK